MDHVLRPLNQIGHRGRHASSHQPHRDGPHVRRGAGVVGAAGQGPRSTPRTVDGRGVALQSVQGQDGVEGYLAVGGWGLLWCLLLE